MIYDEVIFEVRKDHKEKFLSLFKENFLIKEEDPLIQYLFELIRFQTKKNSIKYHQPKWEFKSLGTDGGENGKGSSG